MGMAVEVINSDDLIPIEQHFRVSAGPGAGKTHWLVTHIHNVLYNSKRLTKSKKIACITYTNIGVETILKRLGAVDDKVEVSTMHSFLYKHLVKPYVSFVADEYELNVEKIDGHDDTILSNYSFLNEWKRETNQQRIRNDVELANVFREARWKFDGEELVLKTPYPIRVDGYPVRNDSLLVYKKMAWQKGVLHHDDVLYFSYQIIEKIPFCLEILRKKFPYFFIDEFQDTNPIQTKLLINIGQTETIIGIIGDPAQSIYSFQGARPEDFTNFNLNGLVDYQILNNRRSTNRITDVLNGIRTDITQLPIRNVEGDNHYLIVGDMVESYRVSKSINIQPELMCLTRTNINTNAIKRQIEVDVPTSDLIQELYSIDGDRDRSRTVSCCIKAMELAKENNFSDSIKEMEKIYKGIKDKEVRRKRALSDLIYLLSNYNEIFELSLYDFYQFIKPRINNSLSNLSNRGNIRPFYTSHTYKQMAVCVKVTEEYTPFRTIHKAKGAEFNSIILMLESESDLAFILSPNLSDEEHRINYVAVSRAKEQLFVNVPTLSVENQTIMHSKGFNLVIISENGVQA